MWQRDCMVGENPPDKDPGDHWSSTSMRCCYLIFLETSTSLFMTFYEPEVR